MRFKANFADNVTRMSRMLPSLTPIFILSKGVFRALPLVFYKDLKREWI